jgi:dipeptidyl aminopeptidase/acylaminoacyl peptidase
MLPDLAVSFMKRMLPTLILHGMSDLIVPVAEAYKLERLLKRRGTEYEAEIHPGQGHVFAGAIARASVERTAEFFAKTLHAAV